MDYVCRYIPKALRRPRIGCYQLITDALILPRLFDLFDQGGYVTYESYSSPWQLGLAY